MDTTDAGVVHQHVHGAPPDRGDDRRHAGRAGQIGDNRGHLHPSAAQLGGERLQALGPAGDDDQVVAVASRHPGELTTDAG